MYFLYDFLTMMAALYGLVFLLLLVVWVLGGPILFFNLRWRQRRIEKRLTDLEAAIERQGAIGGPPALHLTHPGMMPREGGSVTLPEPLPAPLPAEGGKLPLAEPIAPTPTGWPSAPPLPMPAPGGAGQPTSAAVKAGGVPPELPMISAPLSAGARSDASTAGSLEERLAGKWLGWVGAIALVVGAALFFYYAVDRQWIGKTGRVVIGILVGTGGFAGGALAMLRGYRVLSQSVVGAAMGILYVTLFAAFRLFGDDPVLPQEVAFVGMTLVTAGALSFATYFNAQSTAVLGLLGGFLTPVMLSTGVDNQWALFIYVLILDVGVIGAATFRKWQTLQILSLAATCFIWAGWFNEHYTEQKLAPTLTLLTAFFVLFALLGIWYNVWNRQKARAADFVVILATPIAYFIALYGVTEAKYAYLHGILAVGLAGTYLALGLWALSRNPEGKRVVVALGGLAATFLTVAIPLQFTGHWIVIAWAAESLILFELGMRFHERKLRYVSLGLLLVVQLLLLSYAVETIRNPEGFETRFTREKRPAVAERTKAATDRYVADAPYASMPPSSERVREISWRELLNGRMFSYLSSAAVLGIIAWEYRRRVTEALAWKFTPAESESHSEGDRWAIAQGICTAASVVTLLAMLLLETFSFGYLKEWTFATHFGLYALWAAAAAVGLLMLAVWVRPQWLQYVGLGAFGLMGMFLLILLQGTMLANTSPLNQIDTVPGPGDVWYVPGINPRGLGFAAAVAAALAGAWLARRLAPTAPRAAERQVKIAMLLAILAYLAALGLFTSEVYAHGVLYRWQTVSNLAVTLTWTLFATAGLLAGIFAGSWLLRLMSLGLFLATTLKVFLYDIWSLEATIRVIAFVALGTALLAVSFFYRRFRERIRAWLTPAAVLLAAAMLVPGPLRAHDGAPPAVESSAGQSPLTTRLRYRWPMEQVPEGSAGLFKLQLPPDLYGKARSDLGDVRVLGVKASSDHEAVREIPYVLHQPQDRLEVVEKTIPLLNLSQKGTTTEFLLDLGDSPQTVNEIEIAISKEDKNYERQVRVFGAQTQDAAEWNLLTDRAHVLDFTRPQHRYTSGLLKFPVAKFKVYKIVVENQQQPPLTIEAAKVRHVKQVRAERETFPADIVSHTTDERRKQSTVLLDLKHVRLPTQALELTIEYEGNFHRHVRVFVADVSNDERRWQEVASGSVYRIQRPGVDAGSARLAWNEHRGRYLRLVIENGDDPPLRVTGATAEGVPRYLVLQQPADAGELALYAGSGAVDAPQYDLSRTIGSFELSALPAARLGAVRANPRFRADVPPPPPWSEQNKALLWSVTIGGVLVLGALTFLLLRKAARVGTGTGE